MAAIYGFIVVILFFVLGIVFNIAVAWAALSVFDWVMGTSFATPVVIGFVALVLFLTRR